MEENYVKVAFRHDAFDGDDIETAWTVKEAEYYRLDNILFYAKGFSWGDLIQVKFVDGEPYADVLVKESGHSTVRILFENIDDVQSTRDQLKSIGCDSELSNYQKLIAVDIPPVVYYNDVIEYLDEGEKIAKWEYQEACISTLHKMQNN